MANNAWFNTECQEHFAKQKIEQMKALGIKIPDGDSPVAQVQAAIDAFNAQNADVPGFEKVTLLSNALYCNSGNYPANTPLAQVNVSPSPMFDVGIYLTNLAINANASGYSATGYQAGEWTASSVLKHMLNDGHMSAWEHFKTQGMIDQINPSNRFDTSAYLTARAAAMGNGATVQDAIAAIQAEGVNPLEDYYEFGQSQPTPITATPVTNTVDSELTGDEIWGVETPVPVDPYAPAETKAATTVNGETLTGENGVNTAFTAVFTQAQKTLGAKDVFTGGTDANNTLTVELGATWGGFNGVPQEGTAELAPNVTNVGRLLINHTTANTEANYTFNTQNIAGLQRVDVVNTGGGTVSFTGLQNTMQELHLTGALTRQATALTYNKGQLSGQNDLMKIVLNGVGTEKTSAQIKVSEANSTTAGIEQITVEASAGTENFVDLSQITSKNAQTLAVVGAGNVDITNVAAKGITSYDASQATGQVNIAVGSINGSTVIKGGSSSFDEITLTTGTNRFDANWTGIEVLNVNSGVTCDLNMSGSDNSLGVLNASGGATLKGITATDFTINQQGTANVKVSGTIDNVTVNQQGTGNTTVNGAIDNFTWNDNTTTTGLNYSGTVTSEATGTVTINTLEGKQQLGSSAIFNFAKAGSVVFSGDIVGGNNSVTLNAASATVLDFTLAHQAVATDNLSVSAMLTNVMSVDLNLKSSNDSPYTFTLQGALPNASEITITGDGDEAVTLSGAIGSSDCNNNINIEVQSVSAFTASGAITTDIGWDITLNIDTSVGKGDVKLSNITAGTSIPGDGYGDVDITVATKYTAGTEGALAEVNGNDLTIIGDALTINFSGVQGTICTGNSVDLSAQSTITYTGNSKSEGVKVTTIGAGQSDFNMGGGSNADVLSFAGTMADGTVIDISGLGTGADNISVGAINISDGGLAKMTINFANDSNTDTLSVTDGTSGQLFITVNGFKSGGDVLNGDIVDVADATAAKGILEAFGFTDVTTTAISAIAGNGGTKAYEKGFTYEGNLYFADGGTSDAVTTLICLTGCNNTTTFG